MKLDLKQIDGVTVLRVKGNLTGEPGTFTIHDKVKQLLAEKITRMVIDLSDVGLINSTGLGMLMGCYTSAKNAGGDIKLTGINEKVKNIFIITKLITIFDVFESVREAIDAFGKA
jgi:anti-sigma B factor antagonist